jgi:hypothetical protein
MKQNSTEIGNSHAQGLAYGETDNVAASKLEAIAQKIRAKLSAIGGDFYEVGQLLCEGKETAGHGQWGRWLQEKFAIGEDTAQNLMRSYQFAKNRKVRFLDINPSALYALSKPSMPEAVRQECIAEAKSGNPPSAAAINARGQQFKSLLPAYQRAIEDGTITADRAEALLHNIAGYERACAVIAGPWGAIFDQLSAEHVQSLLRLAITITPNHAATFGPLVTPSSNRALWALLRNIRPEDCPVSDFRHIGFGEGSPHDAAMMSVAANFVDVTNRCKGKVPAWVVAAAWFACLAIDAPLTPDQLCIAIANFDDRFLAAVHFFRTNPEMKGHYTDIATEEQVWLGHRSDLMHARCETFVKDAPVMVRWRVLDYCIRNDFVAAMPSGMQAWAAAAA